jgi:hypothetical protein
MFIDCIKGQEQTEVSMEGGGTDFMGHLARLSFLLSIPKRGKNSSLLVSFFSASFSEKREKLSFDFYGIAIYSDCTTGRRLYSV